jgi:hypothetical protein
MTDENIILHLSVLSLPVNPYRRAPFYTFLADAFGLTAEPEMRVLRTDRV